MVQERYASGYRQKAANLLRISADTSRLGRLEESGGETWGTRCLKEIFVPGILVQREVHNFWRGHPVVLRGNCSPELGLICAV